MQQRIQVYNNQVNEENNEGEEAAQLSRCSGSSGAVSDSQRNAEGRQEIEDDEAHES